MCKSSVNKLWSQALWARHENNETPVCPEQEVDMLVFVSLLLFLMALLFDGEEVSYFSEEVPNSF